MIYIEPQHKDIIINILKKYPYTVYAFGSRVKGTQRLLSDLDLCIKENISFRERAHLDADFEESNLPYRVDIVIWPQLKPGFQKNIQKDLLLFYKPN